MKRIITILLLLFTITAMYGQRVYTFATVTDAARATYIGIGSTVLTEGYHSSGDGGAAHYKMTAIADAPMVADSGYVYPVTASKVLVQVLSDEYLHTATYGVVCGDSTKAALNYARLQRYFNAIDTLDKQAFVNGCNDTIYVAFSSALTVNLASHDKFVMQGEGSDVTRIKASSGTLAFTFSDNSKVSLFDMYLHGYDATAFGGIGGADQSLTYVNDTLTISGGNYVVITGGGGGGTDDQTLSIDSNASTFTLAIESGNSVNFAKGLQDVVDDTSPTLGGALDADGNNITNLGDVTFKTGAAGGTLRTGTSNADKFELQAYDVNDATYRTVIELDAGNDVRLQMIADYLELEDATDRTKVAMFDPSGISTGTQRTFSLPDSSGKLALLSNLTGLVGATPDGPSGAIQFNRGDSLAGIDSLKYDYVNKKLDFPSFTSNGFVPSLASNIYTLWNPVGDADFRVYRTSPSNQYLSIKYQTITSGASNPMVLASGNGAGADIIIHNTGYVTARLLNGQNFSIAAKTGYGNFVHAWPGGDLGIFSNGQTEQVGINTASIDASAKFEIVSTNSGFLPPRMTSTQRDAISSPATGLTIYCTDCTATDASTGVMQTYNGSTWKNNW